MSIHIQIGMAVFRTVALSSCVRENSFSDVTIGENGITFVLQNASTRSAEGSSIPAEMGIVLPMGKTDSGESLFLEETIEELNATPATKGAPAYTSYVGELYKSMGVYAAGKFGDSWLIENYNPKTVNLRVRGINKYLDFIDKADLAIKYNINPEAIHPHSFRHLFAINFLSRSNDLILLSDLLGHESVDTTRIYLQRSSKDQKRLISQVVDW